MEHLKIGAMAKACDVTPRALRLYQEEGILQPAIVDEETGYRSYSISQFMKLDLIVQLQSAGFTLQEIAEIQREGSPDELRRRCEQQSASLARQVDELVEKKRVADEIAESCASYQERLLCGRVMLERLPERRALIFDAPTWDDLGGDGDYTDNDRWGWYQQYTKRRLVEAGYPIALFKRVGCYVPAEKASPDMSLLLSRPYVFVTPEFEDAYRDATVLEACTCLVAYHDLCHDERGADLEGGQVRMLFEQMDELGLEVAGPFTYENIFRFMRLFNEDASAYFRHCLPVRPAGGAG